MSKSRLRCGNMILKLAMQTRGIFGRVSFRNLTWRKFPLQPKLFAPTTEILASDITQKQKKFQRIVPPHMGFVS